MMKNYHSSKLSLTIIVLDSNVCFENIFCISLIFEYLLLGPDHKSRFD